MNYEAHRVAPRGAVLTQRHAVRKGVGGRRERGAHRGGVLHRGRRRGRGRFFFHHVLCPTGTAFELNHVPLPRQAACSIVFALTEPNTIRERAALWHLPVRSGIDPVSHFA